jgi:hypothetical protein
LKNFYSFIVLVTVITVISHFVAQPFVRGYFCSDTSIRYPYKNDTIPAYAAVLLSIGLPVVSVIESFLPQKDSKYYHYLDVDYRIY